MVLRVAATLCLFVTGVLFATCNFFRSSRRGILTAHWVVINWIMSSNWQSFKQGDIPVISGAELLLPLSTISLVFDHLSTMSSPSEYLCPLSRCLLVLLLCVIDVVCLIIALELRYEVSLVVLSLMLFTGVLLFTTAPMKLNMDNMYDYSTDELFSDYNKASNCLGRYGSCLYIAIFAQLLRDTVPALRFSVVLTYIVYVALSLCTLAFLMTPAYIGGSIHALKTLAAKIADK